MPQKRQKLQKSKLTKPSVAKKQKKVSHTCENCIYLYARHGKKGPCWGIKTTKTNKRACRSYKEGKPFIPTFDKRQAKPIVLPDGEPQAFVLYTSNRQALVVAWTKDLTGRWHWSIRLVGMKPTGGLYRKLFEKDQAPLAAFHGEIEVVGPGLSSLFSSFGFEDVDELDEDGNIVNKPREIKIYPAQARKGVHRGRRKK